MRIWKLPAILAIVGGVFSLVLLAAEHVVDPKGGGVIKNGAIDRNDDTGVCGEPIEEIGGGIVLIKSKVFRPPVNKLFTPFPKSTSYVDIWCDPAELPPWAAPEDPNYIQVAGFFMGQTIKYYPLRAEGNLGPAFGGRGGGAGAGAGAGGQGGAHWSTKTAPVPVQLVLQVNGPGTDDDFVPRNAPNTSGIANVTIDNYALGEQWSNGITIHNDEPFEVSLTDAAGGGKVGFAAETLSLGRANNIWIAEAEVDLSGITLGSTTILAKCPTHAEVEPVTASAGVFWIIMGKIMKGTTTAEHTGDLVIGEDYSFRYRFEPQDMTPPKVRFCIGRGRSIGGITDQTSVYNGPLAVPSLTADASSLWPQTKWNIQDAEGAYARPYYLLKPPPLAERRMELRSDAALRLLRAVIGSPAGRPVGATNEG